MDEPHGIQDGGGWTMVSWRTAAVLWLVAGSSSAILVPYMTDQLLLAVFAIGSIVGIVLAAASLLRRCDRLARSSAATGAVWLVVFATITLANLGEPGSMTAVATSATAAAPVPCL